MWWMRGMRTGMDGRSKPARAGRTCLAAVLLLAGSAHELASAEAEPRQSPAGALGAANVVAVAEIGIKLAPLTPELRQRYGIAHAHAAPVVTEVEPNGPAARKLNAGDEIVQIGSDVVSRVEDVVNGIEALRQPGRTSAVLDVVSPEGYLRFVSVRLRDPGQTAGKG